MSRTATMAYWTTTPAKVRQILSDFDGNKWDIGDMKVSLSDMTRLDTKLLLEELLKSGVNGEVLERAKEAATKTNVGARLNIKVTT